MTRIALRIVVALVVILKVLSFSITATRGLIVRSGWNKVEYSALYAQKIDSVEAVQLQALQQRLLQRSTGDIAKPTTAAQATTTTAAARTSPPSLFKRTFTSIETQPQSDSSSFQLSFGGSFSAVSAILIFGSIIAAFALKGNTENESTETGSMTSTSIVDASVDEIDERRLSEIAAKEAEATAMKKAEKEKRAELQVAVEANDRRLAEIAAVEEATAAARAEAVKVEAARAEAAKIAEAEQEKKRAVEEEEGRKRKLAELAAAQKVQEQQKEQEERKAAEERKALEEARLKKAEEEAKEREKEQLRVAEIAAKKEADALLEAEEAARVLNAEAAAKAEKAAQAEREEAARVKEIQRAKELQEREQQSAMQTAAKKREKEEKEEKEKREKELSQQAAARDAAAVAEVAAAELAAKAKADAARMVAATAAAAETEAASTARETARAESDAAGPRENENRKKYKIKKKELLLEAEEEAIEEAEIMMVEQSNQAVIKSAGKNATSAAAKDEVPVVRETATVMPSTATPVKGKKSSKSIAAAEKTHSSKQSAEALNESFNTMLDQMQELALKSLPAGSNAIEESAKVLDSVLSTLAKVPFEKMENVVHTYASVKGPKAGIMIPATEDSLEFHMRSSLDALWKASDGTWESFYSRFKHEFDDEAKINDTWMRSAAAAANELSESKLKDLIKSYGGSLKTVAKPKSSKSSPTSAVDGSNGGSFAAKVGYVATLVDLLRDKHHNDYRRVSQEIQSEAAKIAGVKGFNSTPAAAVAAGGGGGMTNAASGTRMKAKAKSATGKTATTATKTAGARASSKAKSASTTATAKSSAAKKGAAGSSSSGAATAKKSASAAADDDASVKATSKSTSEPVNASTTGTGTEVVGAAKKSKASGAGAGAAKGKKKSSSATATAKASTTKK